jgi:MFS family permease
VARNSAVERLYALVANEEDARACTDISDQACREVPGNFFRMAGALVLTKMADLLINPKTVLAWLMTAVGAPAALVAWLVPVRESGALIPQLVIGAWVRRHPHRKPFWVLGSILQGLCVLGMAAAVWWLEGAAAGLAIIALLVAFSLSRGLCSVAIKDVEGKTVPRTRRGRLSGLATTLSGVGTLVLTLALFAGQRHPSLAFYAGLLVGAALLWWLAAALFARIREEAGETGGGGNALRQALGHLRLLRDDPPFRHFVITRALLMASALGAPFLVILSHNGGSGWLLGGFVLASALASTVSAGVWGWMADTSSRRVMLRGGALAALICLLGGGLALAGLDSRPLEWLYPGLYFVLAIAHDGVRIGRKTYLVDMASGNRRTDYTSVSNTVIGVLLLIIGGLSALASTASPETALLLLGLMGAGGTLSAWRLREVE